MISNMQLVQENIASFFELFDDVIMFGVTSVFRSMFGQIIQDFDRHVLSQLIPHQMAALRDWRTSSPNLFLRELPSTHPESIIFGCVCYIVVAHALFPLFQLVLHRFSTRGRVLVQCIVSCCNFLASLSTCICLTALAGFFFRLDPVDRGEKWPLSRATYAAKLQIQKANQWRLAKLVWVLSVLKLPLLIDSIVITVTTILHCIGSLYLRFYSVINMIILWFLFVLKGISVGEIKRKNEEEQQTQYYSPSLVFVAVGETLELSDAVMYGVAAQCHSIFGSAFVKFNKTIRISQSIHDTLNRMNNWQSNPSHSFFTKLPLMNPENIIFATLLYVIAAHVVCPVISRILQRFSTGRIVTTNMTVGYRTAVFALSVYLAVAVVATALANDSVLSTTPIDPKAPNTWRLVKLAWLLHLLNFIEFIDKFVPRLGRAARKAAGWCFVRYCHYPTIPNVFMVWVLVAVKVPDRGRFVELSDYVMYDVASWCQSMFGSSVEYFNKAVLRKYAPSQMAAFRDWYKKHLSLVFEKLPARMRPEDIVFACFLYCLVMHAIVPLAQLVFQRFDASRLASEKISLVYRRALWAGSIYTYLSIGITLRFLQLPAGDTKSERLRMTKLLWLFCVLHVPKLIDITVAILKVLLRSACACYLRFSKLINLVVIRFLFGKPSSDATLLTEFHELSDNTMHGVASWCQSIFGSYVEDIDRTLVKNMIPRQATLFNYWQSELLVPFSCRLPLMHLDGIIFACLLYTLTMHVICPLARLALGRRSFLKLGIKLVGDFEFALSAYVHLSFAISYVALDFDATNQARQWQTAKLLWLLCLLYVPKTIDMLVMALKEYCLWVVSARRYHIFVVPALYLLATLDSDKIQVNDKTEILRKYIASVSLYLYFVFAVLVAANRPDDCASDGLLHEERQLDGVIAADSERRRSYRLTVALRRFFCLFIILLVPVCAFVLGESTPTRKQEGPQPCVVLESAACTPELLRDAHSVSQLLVLEFRDGSTTPFFTFNTETLRKVKEHARGQVTTECRIGQARTSKSTSGTIAARAIDIGPCRHRIYFPMSGGAKSFTQFVDILVTITDDKNTRIMLDFEGFEHLDRTNALVSFALLNCDSITTHLAGTLIQNDASVNFLEMLDTALRYYNKADSDFVRARSLSDLPMHFTLLASSHLDTTASQFQTDLEQLLDTKSFAGNVRSVTVHFALETLEQREALNNMSVVPGIPKSDFSDRIISGARASLRADEKRQAVAKSLGMQYLTAEEWVKRVEQSTQFIEGKLTSSSFADQLQQRYCDKILADHRARLNEAYEAVATDRRASFTAWAESELRATWRKHAGSADAESISEASELIHQFVTDENLSQKCANNAVALRDQIWERTKEASKKCEIFFWRFDENNWSYCARGQQTLRGTCSRDCFGAVERAWGSPCSGVGVRTRACSDTSGDRKESSSSVSEILSFGIFFFRLLSLFGT